MKRTLNIFKDSLKAFKKLRSFGFFLIHSLSISTEQRTPAALQIVDAFSSASNIFFVDKDLDQGEAGRLCGL